jgi:hypothetical protein
MRRALLIGVPAPGLDVTLAIERLSPVLIRAGFSIESRVGEQATRKAVLNHLESLVRNCEPDDAYVIYYFGHGGRIRFAGVDEVFGYVTCHAQGGFEAVLDRELSDLLTQLDARCGNVTSIFDCCYSGELVRANGPSLAVAQLPAPDWAREVIEKLPTATLAIDSHPRIVRLGGASPKQQAFALVRGGSNIGVLTEALIDTIEDAGDHWSRLSWASVIHRVRERVFERLRYEGQWPALLGPRTRLLFSTEQAEMPGSVSYVPTDDPRVGFLRAGWHQGVSVGDRWGVAATAVDADGRPQLLAQGVIESVERNRSTWVLERGELPNVAGLPAYPLYDESLDGRAGVRALMRVLVGRRADPCPVRWTWFRVGDVELSAEGANLNAGERICVTLEYSDDAPPQGWFVSVILVDLHGWPRLLNARMPEGVELWPGDREVIGVRSGRREQGVELGWPEGNDAEAVEMSLLFLASRRPMQLGHIVREQPLDEFDALVFQGLAKSPTRTGEPEVAGLCAWEWFAFTLRRKARSF